MKITSARVKNYKSYLDSGEIQFGDRYTVIVGQNSSGKTAFLEALNPSTFRPLPHRTPQKGAFPAIPNPTSEIEYELSISGRELEHAFKFQASQLFVPIPRGLDDFGTRRFITDLFARDRIDFKLTHPAKSGWTTTFPSHRLFVAPGNNLSIRVDISADRQSWSLSSPNTVDSLPDFLGDLLANTRFYGFRAERLNVGQSRINESPELLPDASNLPSVLLQLPRRHHAHEQYQQFIREIFPSIFWVGSRPVSGNDAAIEIIMSDGDARAGITVSLAESGTGIGQVLALLYVVVTAEFPRIIAIDEPNSFLHPGAAKKLLSILKKFDHQYIVSTHSAEIIKIADPEFVHLVEWTKAESTFQTLNRESIQHQRRLLAEIGVSLSDVFGADSVLWVEGPTEERSFPLILDHLGLSSPATSLASIVATDDLSSNRPRAKLAWDVYEKLSQGSALLPPALSFVLDREDRTDKEIDDLIRASRGKVRFLPRRTYENYLIDADAIAAILSDISQEKVTANTVSAWIEANRTDRKYAGPPPDNRGWESSVNAPVLLYDLFNTISDAKVEYRKTTHSVRLTEWLLANKPNHLVELFEFLKAIDFSTT